MLKKCHFWRRILAPNFTILAPNFGSIFLSREIWLHPTSGKWCNAHNLTKIRHVYVKTTDPEIAFMVPEEDITDDLLKQPWLQDKGRAIMKGSCAHRCYVMAAWVPRGPRIDFKDITYCALEASTVFAAEDSRLGVIADSQVVQLFAQTSDPPGLK